LTPFDYTNEGEWTPSIWKSLQRERVVGQGCLFSPKVRNISACGFGDFRDSILPNELVLAFNQSRILDWHFCSNPPWP
jgi:hypothetical protein